MWVSSSRKNDKFRHIKNSTMISLNFLTFWLWMKNLIKLSQKEHLVIVCTYLGEKKSDKIRHVKNSWKRNNVHWFLRISKFFDVSGFVKNLSQKWYAIILDVYGENTRNDDFCGFLIFWLLWSFIEESAAKMISKGQLISKCLFGVFYLSVFTFFQKTNENKSTSSKVEFVGSFFGRNVGLKKSFRICLTFNSYNR